MQTFACVIKIHFIVLMISNLLKIFFNETLNAVNLIYQIQKQTGIQAKQFLKKTHQRIFN